MLLHSIRVKIFILVVWWFGGLVVLWFGGLVVLWFGGFVVY